MSGLNGEEGAKKGGGIQAFLVAILLMTGAVANPNPRPEFTLIPVASTVPIPSVMAEPNSIPNPTNLTSYPSPKFIKPPTPSLSQTVTPSSHPNLANATYGFVTSTYSGQPSAQPSAQPSPSVKAMDETVTDITGGILVALALAGKGIQTLWNFKNNKNKEGNSVEISEEDDLIETLRAELAKKEAEIKESAKTILKLTSIIRSKSCKTGGGSNSDEMINTIVKLTGGPPRSAEIVKNTLNSKEGGSKRRTRRLHKRKN